MMKIIFFIFCVITFWIETLLAFESNTIPSFKRNIQIDDKRLLFPRRESILGSYLPPLNIYSPPTTLSFSQQLPYQYPLKSYLSSGEAEEQSRNFDQFSSNKFGKSISTGTILAALNTNYHPNSENRGNIINYNDLGKNVETYLVASKIADGFLNDKLISNAQVVSYRPDDIHGLQMQSLVTPSKLFSETKLGDGYFAPEGDLDEFSHSHNHRQVQPQASFIHHNSNLPNENVKLNLAQEENLTQRLNHPSFTQLSIFGDESKAYTGYDDRKYLLNSRNPQPLRTLVHNPTSMFKSHLPSYPPKYFSFDTFPSHSSPTKSNYNIPQYAIGHKGLRHYQSHKPLTLEESNLSNYKGLTSSANVVSSGEKSLPPFKPSVFLGATLEQFTSR